MHAMNAVFGHDAIEVSDMKTDHGMIDAVARPDPSDDDPISAGLELEFVQHPFHGGLVETIVRGFLNDLLTGYWAQIVDEICAGTAE
jgi:hypothetical protein